jgi:hypothetical protein
LKLKEIYWGFIPSPHTWNNEMVEEWNDGKPPIEPQYGFVFSLISYLVKVGFPMYHPLIIPKPIFPLFHCSNIPIMSEANEVLFRMFYQEK